jgi:hypothetical protein
MKILFLISIIGIVIFSSCNEAKFDRYPGQKLDTIPVAFRGVYLDPDKKAKRREFITVDENYYYMSGEKKKYELGDSMVLSIYKDAYFLSSLSSDNFWYITYVKPSGKDLHLYQIVYDEKLANDKNSVTRYFTPKMDKDSNYLFTMDEEKLYMYTKKELLKEGSMKLKRKK